MTTTKQLQEAQETCRNLLESLDKLYLGSGAWIVPEEEQIQIILDNPASIQYIKIPSLRVQIAAVRKNPTVIRFISDPCELIQILAVKHDGNIIRFIKNPTIAVRKLSTINILSEK